MVPPRIFVPAFIFNELTSKTPKGVKQPKVGTAENSKMLKNDSESFKMHQKSNFTSFDDFLEKSKILDFFSKNDEFLYFF